MGHDTIVAHDPAMTRGDHDQAMTNDRLDHGPRPGHDQGDHGPAMPWCMACRASMLSSLLLYISPCLGQTCATIGEKMADSKFAADQQQAPSLPSAGGDKDVGNVMSLPLGYLKKRANVVHHASCVLLGSLPAASQSES